jgi:hypothetical protein
VRKAVVVVVSVLVVLGLVGFAADRAVAAVAERAINDRVAQIVPGATSVSTRIVGFPVLTQVVRGSLDQVRVALTGVPAGSGLTLDAVDVDLYGVTVLAPRTATTVTARAHASTAALAALGDGWTVTPDGTALVVARSGLIPIEARVTPVVRDGALALDLGSVTVLGVIVDASNVPSTITSRITRLTRSFSALPLGLVPTAVTGTPTGADLAARGSQVALEAT